ncbi:sensor histidine kinase [Proteocatella sphenisci]|uniref:sensor histidine kinase n=1 Tax=Proteocatella sphenisci TaxID=181070 RepID=UPI00048C8C30|nr:HAMP domain-containing sensor histidine kinase [Proteocatella sphenisci]
MRMNIRQKLFVVFVILIIMVVGVGSLLNALLLEKYYIKKNEAIFIKTAEVIQEELKKGSVDIDDLIQSIDRADNISIIIMNNNYEVLSTSYPRNLGIRDNVLNNEMRSVIRNGGIRRGDGYIFKVMGKNDNQASALLFASQIQPDKIILMSKQIKGIQLSVAISNEFYLYVGIFMIFLGFIFTTVFSKKISSPIVEMSRIATNISNLKFDERIEIRTEDEIGDLGSSINNISEKLSESIGKLRNDIEQRKQLVRNISHEMKTPIGVVKGYSEALQFGVADTEEKREKYFKVISEECDRMNNMINEILEISMLEEAVAKPHMKKIKIEVMLTSIAERFESSLKLKKITIQIQCQEDLLIYADYKLLERAVGNFVSNAVKYADEGGEVIMKAFGDQDKVTISVYNSGSHIKPEDLDKIWDVFYKVDKARSRNQSGHGIGLSIVRTIVSIHAGQVFVKNHDNGVEFSMELPISV